jgi:Cna protein B-type domain.
MTGIIRKCACVLAAILSLGSVPGARSQSNNASVDGVITDPNGSSVSGATVVLTSKDNGATANFTSDADGSYSFRNVVPGNYQLKVTAPGFGDYLQEGILVRVGYPIRLNIKLDLASTNQKIEVNADASVLNFENAELRGSIDPQVIQQVPLLVSGSIRSAANFASLLPGVTRGSGDVTGAHVNGGQSQSGVVILDGISLYNSSGVQGLTGAVLDFPQSPDLISEFQVLTSNYDAQYGSAAGVTIENVKSGTANFHGTAYEFNRNSSFNAKQWGAADKSKDIENDFGGNFGGPLKLPIFKGRDHRTYFFVNFEGFKITGGVTRQTLSLPSVAEQHGDFRDWVDSDGNLIPIYDPATTRPNPAYNASLPISASNQQYLRDQFMGCDGNTPNVICATDPRLQNSLASQWFKYLPSLTSSGPLNNYLAPATPAFLGTDAYTFTEKIDEYIGQKDHISEMFFYKYLPQTEFTTLPVEISNSGTSYKRTSVLRVGWDHTFNSRIVNHAGFGFQDDKFYGGGVDGNSADAVPQIPGVASHEYPPVIQFNGVFAQFGTGQGDPNIQPWLAPAYLANDVVSLTLGKHTVSFGGDLRFSQNSPTFLTNQSGNFNFAATETGIQGVNSGSPIASFLLEQVDSANATFYTSPTIRAHTKSFSLFVGDTWRATTKLTVTTGLRWEIDPPVYEGDNRFSYFDPNEPNPGVGNLPGAVAFAGFGPGFANRRSPEAIWYKGFAPRIGLSYAIRPRTVVRSGYGIFYDNASMPGYDGGITQDGYNTFASFGSSLGGLQPAFILSDGLPQTFPVPPQLVSTFDNGLNTPVYRPRNANRLPYAQQWNLTVEHEFTSHDYIAVSYVGNKGTRLLSQVDPINALNPSYLTSLGGQLNDVFQPGQTELDGVPEPFPNFATTMIACAPSVAQALLPFPQYCNGITARNENQGNSTYHSFQVKAEHRFANGLWALLTYTNSKLLTDADASENIYGSTVFSPFEPQRRKALAFEDVPQALNIAYNYDLPFGTGRRWLTHGGFVNSVLGGWTFNGVFRAQSGIPFQITSSFCNVPEQIRAQCIPGLVGGANPFAQSLGNLDVSQSYLNVSSFESVNDFNFYTGNGPRTHNFRQPGYSDFDMGLQKIFHVSERVTFQLRGDAFNVFNAHHFNSVGVSLQGGGVGGSAFNTDLASGADFGKWNGLVTSPRNLQVSGRISF